MIRNVTSGGGRILACPPCAKVRGYAADDLVDGVTIAGKPAMLEVVKEGAATLSFGTIQAHRTENWGSKCRRFVRERMGIPHLLH